MIKILNIFACIVVLALPLSPAMASGQPRLQATYDSWNAYTMIEDGEKVCFMANDRKSKDPKDKTPTKPSKRGDFYALITHRPGEGERNVFSFIAGYDYKPGAEAVLEIDAQKFNLFIHGDTAWAPDAETDNKIAKAIQNGKKMTMRGVSKKGLKTADDINLTGATKAYDWITRECY
jgi:hypothetical protein